MLFFLNHVTFVKQLPNYYTLQTFLMKKFGPVLLTFWLFSFCFISCPQKILAAGMLPGKVVLRVTADEPRAIFEKLWVDHDVYENGIKGMRIHVKFTAYDMLNMEAMLAIYFEYDDELGGPIEDKNQKYTSTEGDVAVYKSIKPAYNPAVYNDLQVFMPYDELDLDPGEYDLLMIAKLIYPKGGLISYLTTHYFIYNKPQYNQSGAPAANAANATFEKLWVDFDAFENNRKGMRIHVKFRVFNMKEADSYLAIYFETKTGEKLKTENTAYRSQTGQVAVYRSLKPGYEESIYDDLQLFMPYDELKLRSGRHDLKMDADVILKNGDLVKHLTYYEFWVQQ